MTKELLQKELDKNNVKAKILLVKKTRYNDYEVIYTRDLSYSISESELLKRGCLTAPEEDVLVTDIDEAFFMIRYSLSEKAWYGE